jgi:hypothetical protein
MEVTKCKKCKRILPEPSTHKSSFYKRLLPDTCIAFNSTSGKALFKQALETDYMESYFSLSLQFLTQSEPAYCGIAFLCMCLNALEIDPLRQWRGVWRWYDETMLDCCRPLDDVRANGITLPEFVCLAKCNGLDPEFHRADWVQKTKFLEDLKSSCQSPDEYMVVSYSRKTLGQTGDGHFSPIGGYNEKENMVLILDVARFKYPSYWVSFDLLWEALFPIDSVTRQPRGYVLLSRRERSKAHAFCQLGINVDTWSVLDESLSQVIPSALAKSPQNSVQQFIETIIVGLPDRLDCIVQNRAFLFRPCSQVELGPESDQAMETYLTGLNVLLSQVSTTELYSLVKNANKVKSRPHTPRSSIESLPEALSLNPELRRSLSSLSVGCHAIDDYAAFLTLFLFALWKFRPELFQLVPSIANRLGSLFNSDAYTSEILDEVNLLLQQLQAISTSSCCVRNCGDTN